ncbi:MAG: DUF2232 domain-containing protein [Alphaproteobacteria bacterium]|nr:MAG: DUF2232 domain-containing protein [Alphaproteobacteria bacterium]
MSKKVIVGVLAGLATAVLYFSFVWIAPISLITAFFTPLPLMLAGLSFGTTAAAIASILVVLVATFVLEISLAFSFLLLIALPTLVLTYLVLLNRQIENQNGKRQIEWYPMGRLLTWLTFMGAAFLCIAIFMAAGEEGGLQGQAEAALLTFFGGREQIEEMLLLTKSAITADEYISAVATALPTVAAIGVVLHIAANAGIAQRILTRQGRAIRPSPRLHDLSFPLPLDLALALSAALSFMPGEAGFVGASLAALFVMPYFLLGLVVVHAISTRWPSRGLFLAMFYLALFVFSALAVLIAVLGLLETSVGLRKKFAAGAKNG